MTAVLLHFQLRPWTPRRFSDDVRQALIGLTYQFPVIVEFFEDHNADQSARLAPTSDCDSNWLIMTADSRGIAVLSADATPLGVFRTGPELRTALLPVVSALSACSTASQPNDLPVAVARRAAISDDQGGTETGTGQAVGFIQTAERHGTPTMDDRPRPNAPF